MMAWDEKIKEIIESIKSDVEKIRDDKKITLADTAEIYDIVYQTVLLVEVMSKVVPNWDKDKRDTAVKIIDEAVDLGEFHFVLGAIDKTNVDRILLGYLVDQTVTVLNRTFGHDWEKIDLYIKYYKEYKDIIDALIEYIDQYGESRESGDKK